MKSIIIFVALFATVLAETTQIPIIRQIYDLNFDGTHSYVVETGNGIYEDQQGYSKGPELQAVQGQYQYISPEGQVIHLRYVADENGFQPQGDHLPTSPPIPEEISRHLKDLKNETSTK